MTQVSLYYVYYLQIFKLFTSFLQLLMFAVCSPPKSPWRVSPDGDGWLNDDAYEHQEMDMEDKEESDSGNNYVDTVDLEKEGDSDISETDNFDTNNNEPENDKGSKFCNVSTRSSSSPHRRNLSSVFEDDHSNSLKKTTSLEKNQNYDGDLEPKMQNDQNLLSKYKE